MSGEPVSGLAAMIAGMSPSLRDGQFVFVTLDDRAITAEMRDASAAIVREGEGTTLILPLELAQKSGLPAELPMRQISLTVHSALEAVGLTAAFSAALARRNMASNVVAGYYHDHVFVPADRAEDAMAALRELAKTG